MLSGTVLSLSKGPSAPRRRRHRTRRVRNPMLKWIMASFQGFFGALRLRIPISKARNLSHIRHPEMYKVVEFQGANP